MRGDKILRISTLRSRLQKRTKSPGGCSESTLIKCWSSSRDRTSKNSRLFANSCHQLLGGCLQMILISWRRS